MADISIEIFVQGVEELQKLFNDTIPNALTDGIRSALEDLRTDIEERTTSLCPVRTGALRNSIDITLTDDYTISAVAGMDYASFVDLGTRKMEAEPFFTDPINELFDNFESQLENKVDSSLQNL